MRESYEYVETGLEIAVIGISCRFPGAKDVAGYWKNLQEGVESIRFFSDEELLAAGVAPEALKNPNYVKAKGLLEDIEYFDAGFFGYSPREGELMDPQFRVYHECSWAALEDAGYNPETYDGLIGVYAGASNNLYWVTNRLRALNDPSEMFQVLNLNGNAFSMRLSYKMNLKGPSVSLQTACSTSLVAIHYACQGLLSGECDMALAGGVSITLPNKKGYLYQEGMIKSPDGHCRAFDAKAQGTVFGDGVGVVLLKRLEDAIADGDHIYAVVKGSAINNDGNRKVSYTAPSTNGQAEVIKSAHKMAEVEPESIGFIETHGTGTVLGDPIEMEALNEAFDTEKKGFCGLGAVKTNIGHLDAAAGVAGFIKTVLTLYHKQIPPTLHFETPNPKINFEDSPFYVNTELREWKQDKYPLRAGVSSFGIGGTNAHVVLEEHLRAAEVTRPGRASQLLLLSAKTPTSLEKAAEQLAEYLHGNPEKNLADIAYVLQVGRKAFKYRKMLVCKGIDEAYEILTNPDLGRLYSSVVEKENRPIVFMFSGQGSQYMNMGLELYQTEKYFREEVDHCFTLLQPYVGLNLKTILYPDHGKANLAEMINQTELTQPILFTFEYALAKLLMQWGIEPYAMIGHSIGEYVAACLSGVFSLEDALKLVAHRGQLMKKIPTGSMLSVPLSEEELIPMLPVEISLAAVNGQAACVVAGSHETITEFAASLEAKGLTCRKLHTSHAFHSVMMEPILAEFQESVRRVRLHRPELPYISNVTGDWITVEEAQNPVYWVNHLRNTVRFHDGLSRLYNEVKGIYVEVGPGNTLSTFARKHAQKGDGNAVIDLIQHPGSVTGDQSYLFQKLGQLWLAGVDIDWLQLYTDEKRQRISLPTYPFEQKRFSIGGGAQNISEVAALPELNEVQDWMGETHERPEMGTTYVAPKNDLEEMIAEVAQAYFGFNQIGIHDNFFDLGASSLDMTQLARKLSEKFDRDIATVTVFTYPTIHALAQFFNNYVGDAATTKDLFSRSQESKEEMRKVREAVQTQLTGERGNGFPIAVIGMAGRFPGASNMEEFWINLKNGVESIRFFSDEELIQAGVDPEVVKNPKYVKAKGYLEGIEYFDAGFFDYTPREAALMDPQFRIFHECSWEALEDAGYNPDTYPGLIGLYGGVTANLPWLGQCLADLSSSERFGAMILNDREFLTTQISYKLNLTGPSVSMQTACSTSLVNISMACQGLLTGTCDIALAGGISISLPQKTGYFYQEGNIKSPDGHCRAFDAQAEGTIFGDGVGIVVLKRLEDAQRDRDHIYAVIKGFGLNNDGNQKVGFTAPSTTGQAEAIKAAYQMGDIEPETISYIEAHGTGTNLGDPIEMEALQLAFATEKKGFCGIGSVKTNIGHLNAAAGAAGFIKTVLALKNKLIPPSLHFETPNPKIHFEESPFFVNTELKEWKRGATPLRAGVSSFGIGGTNAHVVLEEAPEADVTSQSRDYQMLLFSAKTPAALEQRVERMADYLQTCAEVDLADVAYTLQVGRKEFAYRKMVVVKNREEACLALTSPESGQIYSGSVDKENRPVIFMFSGQGSQYINMGLELYRKESIFRQEVDHCFDILKSYGDLDWHAILYPEGETDVAAELINRTDVTQPIIFTFEYALAKLLMHWGIEPYAMIGHSIGEYVAACLAGVFSLEEGLQLVARRGQLMGKMPTGSMLSVPLSEAEILPLLGDQLTVAAVNGPHLSVVSGEDAAINEFAAQLQSRGLSCRKLQTSHAFHSRMMEPMLEEFMEIVKQVRLNQPERPYISNVTGGWITVEEAQNPGYWVKHLRETVRFEQGLNQLMEKSKAIFVEVGPGNALSIFARKHGQMGSGHQICNLIRHPHEELDDQYYLLHKVGQLWLAGVKLDWEPYYADEKRQRLPLPTYPFEKNEFKVDVNSMKAGAETLSSKLTLTKNKEIADWFYVPSWKRSILPLAEKGEEEALCWLIFTDQQGIGSQLADQLKLEGHRVVLVQAGSAFSKDEQDVYTLNPGVGQEYHLLFDDLQKMERLPHKIVHLWGVSGEAEEHFSTASFERGLDCGYYSLIYLAQAVGKQKQEVQISVITNNMQQVTGDEAIRPEKITVLAPCKVIPQEYMNLRCCSIDILLPPPHSLHEKRLIERLVDEVKNNPPTDPVVAYRGAYRWVQNYEHIAVPKPEKADLSLRDHGVYLITGGLGNIGGVLTEYLANTVQARLIVTSRSAFPQRDEWDAWLASHDANDSISKKIQRIHSLEQLGAEVLVLRADASNEKDMMEAVRIAENHFGPIHGIFHAAGLPGGSSFRAIEEMGHDKSEEQFASKVYGLQVLEQIVQEKEIDFCVLFSSLASLLGGLGFTAYSAANLFLDSYSQKHNQTSSVPWKCINWDAWKFKEHTSTLGASLAELSIVPEDGMQLFDYVLSGDLTTQLVISTGNLQARMDQWIHRSYLQDQSESKVSFYSRPQLANPYIAPRNQVEKTLTEIWQNFLRIEQVGIHDNFFDLGASSLDLIQVNGKINEVYNKNLPVVTLFTYPTISSFAQFLEAEPADELSTEENEIYATMNQGKRRLVNQRKTRMKGDQNEQD